MTARSAGGREKISSSSCRSSGSGAGRDSHRGTLRRRQAARSRSRHPFHAQAVQALLRRPQKPPRAPELALTHIDSDTHQPRLHGTVSSKPRPSPQRTQKGVLHRVLRLLGVPKDGQCRPVQAVLIFFHQRLPIHRPVGYLRHPLLPPFLSLQTDEPALLLHGTENFLPAVSAPLDVRAPKKFRPPCRGQKNGGPVSRPLSLFRSPHPCPDAPPSRRSTGLTYLKHRPGS